MTVCPYVPPSCSHPRRQTGSFDLCSHSHRISVILTLAYQRPGRAHHAVGQRQSDQHLRLAHQHPCEPRAFGSTFACSPPHNCDGSSDQQSPDILLAHLRCSAKALLAAARMLPRSQANPCREVAAFRKCLHRRREGRDRRCGNRANDWNSGQPPRSIVCASTSAQFGILAGDLLAQIFDLIQKQACQILQPGR